MRRMLLVVLLAVGLVAAACGPSGGRINIYTPDARLVIRDVFVFSTAAGVDTPARTFRVKNVGQENLQVRNIVIEARSGAPGAFRLASGQRTSFTLTPNQETTVGVIFRPGTTFGKHTASLFVESSDAGQPRDELFLRGWHAQQFENSREPNRAQIVDTVGFRTNVGTGLPQDAVNTGEERRSALWRRAAGGPVVYYPLARYATRTSGATGNTFWYPQGDTRLGGNRLYGFDGCNCTDPAAPTEDGGENQKLVPQPNTSTVSFNPTGNFGVSLFASGEYLYSDDNRNDAPGTNSNTHNFRFWPARDMAGAVIANTWIVGIDLGLSGATNPNKNYDYQDFMYVLSNATPA